MTLQEAINTGMPFRRPDRVWWTFFDAKGLLVALGHEKETITMRRDSFLAEDWIPMTREELATFMVDKAEQWIQDITKGVSA